MRAIPKTSLFYFVAIQIGLGQTAVHNPTRDRVAERDSITIASLIDSGTKRMFNRPDSAIFYGTQALNLASIYNFPEYSLGAFNVLSRAYRSLGNDAKALQVILKGLSIAEKNDIIGMKATLLMQSGDIYAHSNNFDKSLEVLREACILFKPISIGMYANTKNYLGETYLLKGDIDSALNNFQSVYNLSAEHEFAAGLVAKCLVNLGKVHELKGNGSEALNFQLQAIEIANEPSSKFLTNFETARWYKNHSKRDSAIYFGIEALRVALGNGLFKNAIEASELLSNIHEGSDFEMAHHYGKIASAYKDSLFAMSNNAAIEGLSEFDEKQKQLELEAIEADYQSKIRVNIFLGSSFTLIVVLMLIYRNSRQNKKNKEIVESAYHQLQSTQSQLIQSEKMASLGELTAGIAHEIQNPLNFVNNFSEVNTELIAEAAQENKKGNIQEVEHILKDIKDNSEKINQHGKRADGIVKGMLQHSQKSSGQKELTDLNALCDEYLRLSYHGYRAKDKSFNAKFETDFDSSLPKINVVPQDIGRVLMNLINNAFYAVSEKMKRQTGQYDPTVMVSTKLVGDKIQISVQDNGNGIPDSIKEKIFQPFFTTKPTGQGTGLGLSLSYDIVKAHGGELRVDGMENKGSEFIVSIPTA